MIDNLPVDIVYGAEQVQVHFGYTVSLINNVLSVLELFCEFQLEWWTCELFRLDSHWNKHYTTQCPNQFIIVFLCPLGCPSRHKETFNEFYSSNSTLIKLSPAAAWLNKQSAVGNWNCYNELETKRGLRGYNFIVAHWRYCARATSWAYIMKLIPSRVFIVRGWYNRELKLYPP